VTVREPNNAASSHLRVERMPLARSLELGADHHGPFGALSYGEQADVPWMSSVKARVLSPAGPMVDVWHAGAQVQSGTTGPVRWRTDGNWLLGAVDLDETAENGGLAELSRRTYQNLFEALEQADCPHLLRLWNYLPQINADGGGLER
jgi:chorismate lyase / 3-hydroxybenzoate synthase